MCVCVCVCVCVYLRRHIMNWHLDTYSMKNVVISNTYTVGAPDIAVLSECIDTASKALIQDEIICFSIPILFAAYYWKDYVLVLLLKLV